MATEVEEAPASVLLRETMSLACSAVRPPHRAGVHAAIRRAQAAIARGEGLRGYETLLATLADLRDSGSLAPVPSFYLVCSLIRAAAAEMLTHHPMRRRAPLRPSRKRGKARRVALEETIAPQLATAEAALFRYYLEPDAAELFEKDRSEFERWMEEGRRELEALVREARR